MWADNEAPEDYEFAISEPESKPMAQIFTSLNPDVDGPTQRFWHTLASAKERISFSTPRATLRLDATDLGAALKRFQLMCLPIFPPPYTAPK
jgi:hypothetical protein